MLKRKELDQMKDKSVAETLKDVKAAEQELLDLRMKKHRGSVNNVHQIRQLRKKIAQLQTLVALKEVS